MSENMPLEQKSPCTWSASFMYVREERRREGGRTNEDTGFEAYCCYKLPAPFFSLRISVILMPCIIAIFK